MLHAFCAFVAKLCGFAGLQAETDLPPGLRSHSPATRSDKFCSAFLQHGQQ